MTDEELIEQLRGEPTWGGLVALTKQAADRIEALLNLNEALVELMDDRDAKLAKAMEALQWCSGSADFNEGGVAREGWLKVCAPLLKGESHD